MGFSLLVLRAMGAAKLEKSAMPVSSFVGADSIQYRTHLPRLGLFMATGEMDLDPLPEN